MNYTYQPPTLTVDTVIFELGEAGLEVLLIKRAREPFKNRWALPGGYNPAGKTTQAAMAQVLSAKAGVAYTEIKYVEQLYTFDTVARDPRGHAVSVTYMGLGKDITPRSSPTTERPTFFPLDTLPKLAFDHASIIAYAHERLRSKVAYTNSIKALLPETFTLPQLQTAYEVVLGRPLDRRNFRKKLQAQGLVHPTGEYVRDGAHRPAQLYTFRHQDIVYLDNLFV